MFVVDLVGERPRQTDQRLVDRLEPSAAPQRPHSHV